MEWSDEQEKALEYMEKNWNKKPINVLTGFAGSGKSTIISELIRRLKIPKHKVAYCAYTGCAAMVLKRKGINAQTIHHLIYNTKVDEATGEFYSTLKFKLDEDYKLIIIDEGSFVTDKLLDDMLTFNIPIIMLGDEGQLPPPLGNMNEYISSPDVRLTKIFRQENGSSIIDFATNLRKGIFNFTFNDNNVKCLNELNYSMLEWADQILCCTNENKDILNKAIRQKKGFTANIPEVGDKLICLRNNWHKLPYTGPDYELVNGMTGYVEEILDIHFSSFVNFNYMEIIFSLDFNKDIKYRIMIDLNPFLGKNPAHQRAGLELFDYGYAISIHKSQGSQWDKVLVYARNSFGDKKKLFYTAATRAADKLVWVS